MKVYDARWFRGTQRLPRKREKENPFLPACLLIYLSPNNGSSSLFFSFFLADEIDFISTTRDSEVSLPHREKKKWQEACRSNKRHGLRTLNSSWKIQSFSLTSALGESFGRESPTMRRIFHILFCATRRLMASRAGE